MPAYRIKTPSPYANLFRQALLMGAQGGMRGAEQAMGDERDLLRQKELLRYRQELEEGGIPDLSKATIEQLGARYDRIAQELIPKESEALKTGNVEQLRAVKKARGDLQLLKDTLKRKMEERSKEDVKEALQMESAETQRDIFKERLSRLKKTPIPTSPAGSSDLTSLTSELRAVQAAIARYETGFLPIPEELQQQQEDLLFQISELRKRRGVPQPPPRKPQGPPAPKDLTGKSTEDLLKTFTK